MGRKEEKERGRNLRNLPRTSWIMRTRILCCVGLLAVPLWGACSKKNNDANTRNPGGSEVRVDNQLEQNAPKIFGGFTT